MPARPIVVMGVSGSGKSTVAKRIADALHGTYLDADDLHPASNVHKMEHGVPLTDEDRWPWLDSVGRAIKEHDGDAGPVVMACSALRRTYRDRIRLAEPGIYFVFLRGTRAELERRLQRREGHFMPASLLDSQLATLEPLSTDELGEAVDISGGEESVTARALAGLEAASDG